MPWSWDFVEEGPKVSDGRVNKPNIEGVVWLLFSGYSKMWKNKHNRYPEFVIKWEEGESFGKLSAVQIKNEEMFLEDDIRGVAMDCLLEITIEERQPGSSSSR